MSGTGGEQRAATAAEIFGSLPLYSPIPMGANPEAFLYGLMTYEKRVDLHCQDCGKEAVFVSPQVNTSGVGVDTVLKRERVFTRTFVCSRVSGHTSHFQFLWRNLTLSKIGQYPSLADLSQVELKRYRKFLPDKDYKELSRATGLASHGVGIGAFVYLRRIFERLIEEARTTASQEASWNEEAFSKSRMAEKIALLEHYLPLFWSSTKLCMAF